MYRVDATRRVLALQQCGLGLIQDSTLFMGIVCWFSTLQHELFGKVILPLIPMSSHFT